MQCRDDWQERINTWFTPSTDHTNFPALRCYSPPPVQERRSIKVLSLFDGIGSYYVMGIPLLFFALPFIYDFSRQGCAGD